MRNITKVSLVAVSVLLVLTTTATFGTSFSGTGSGSYYDGIQTHYPFQPWEGELTYGPNEFNGFWNDDEDNWIYGAIDLVDGTYFFVGGLSNQNAGTWAYNDFGVGKWVGYFVVTYPDVADTAAGSWNAYINPSTNCGDWYTE